jgi:hypothetical protein
VCLTDSYKSVEWARMSDITLECLVSDLASIAPGDAASISGTKLRALLTLVAPIKSPQASRLRRVREIANQDEIILTSYEVQLLLTFLREIKRRQTGKNS